MKARHEFTSKAEQLAYPPFIYVTSKPDPRPFAPALRPVNNSKRVKNKRRK